VRAAVAFEALIHARFAFDRTAAVQIAFHFFKDAILSIKPGATDAGQPDPTLGIIRTSVTPFEHEFLRLLRDVTEV
jgi:hypothetical protein